MRPPTQGGGISAIMSHGQQAANPRGQHREPKRVHSGRFGRTSGAGRCDGHDQGESVRRPEMQRQKQAQGQEQRDGEVSLERERVCVCVEVVEVVVVKG